MILADVMAEIAERIRSISGLTVFDYLPGSLTTPAAVVDYPDEMVYDATYGRGMDTMTIPVVVVVGRWADRSTRDQLTAYANGSGERSIKASVEGPGAADAFDTVRVTGFEIDVVTIGGVDHLSATFGLDITGQGD